MLRDRIQELRELGLRGTAFRVGWELKLRSGLAARLTRSLGPSNQTAGSIAARHWTARLPFADPVSVADAVRDRIPPENRGVLQAVASEALRGRVLCFGRWTGDYGSPVDWHRNPLNGKRWNASLPWSEVLTREHGVGDVKLTWEIARFPHAYHLARAAAFEPARQTDFAAALLEQLEDFVSKNPVGVGVHWASGQEVAFRLMAWVFALDALLSRSPAAERAAELVAPALLTGTTFIAQHIDYARIAVYNNHLLSEALGLFMTGVLLADAPEARGWREQGHRILVEETARQLYKDGAYIQQSHNYHRVALQTYLWACLFARASGDRPDPSWHAALERSLDFLYAHQNPADGRLPNYGANDGALPSLFSTCDFSDFRPLLQAVSLEVRGERLYAPGPWDETSAWLHGTAALDAPLRAPARRSVSFRATGYHVLRGSDPGTYATFRCGTIRDRFSQIDMLHLDVWWKGLNVLVDPGSYLYNAEPELHEHFLSTAAHNTLTVDGRDQMVHFRRFKTLYWTQAELLGFDAGPWGASVHGEHQGFRRYPGGCVHRRSVLAFDGGPWVVVDTITGVGDHTVRLHWLGGEFPHEALPDGMRLDTPAGPFTVRVYDAGAQGLSATVVAGQERPLRGWLSRYYGEKVAVPSLAVERSVSVPATFISVLSPGDAALSKQGETFTVGEASAWRFRIDDGVAVAL